MESGANRIEFPSSSTAGVNFSAECVLPDYPAPAWTVSAILRGPSVINLAADSDGTTHSFNVQGAQTAPWTAGAYWVSIRATSGGDVVEIAQRQLAIKPDLAQAPAGYDGRSQAEIALDAIKAVLANRATKDQQRYTINHRELWRTPIADLLKLRAHYTTLVRRERAIASGKSTFGRAVQVRFSQ